MVDDNSEAQQDDAGGATLFVVRLGEGDNADFAVCERVGTVPGDRRLPGSGQTVAELVEQQALMAAAVASGDQEALDDLVFMAQSGKNADDHD